MSSYILQDQNAVFYECGYSCDNEILLVSKDEKFLLTDARYGIEASELSRDTEVIIIKDTLIKECASLIKKLGLKELIFDPNDFTYAQFIALNTEVSVKFISRPNFSKLKRIVKTSDEISLLKQASTLGAKCFDEFAYLIKFGSSEKELFFYAEQTFKQKGECGLSFEPIVAINQNTAKAHALPSEKKLKNGDLFLLDAGVRYQKYCSDRTRTACFDGLINFSKDQIFKSQKQNEIYEIVKEAQKKAIEFIKPGVLAKEIDAVAREIIVSNGYEKQFFHSTGHGVGLDIHELPIISQKSDTVIKEGMVFSVEPGIYIENEFGVRIEDVVVVTPDGCEIL